MVRQKKRLGKVLMMNLNMIVGLESYRPLQHYQEDAKSVREEI